MLNSCLFYRPDLLLLDGMFSLFAIVLPVLINLLSLRTDDGDTFYHRTLYDLYQYTRSYNYDCTNWFSLHLKHISLMFVSSYQRI